MALIAKLLMALCIPATTVASVLLLAPHLVINHTESLPPGLYWRAPVPVGGLKRGDLAVICIPNAFKDFGVRNGLLGQGQCAGVESMLKVAIGLPGDVVWLRADGVTVNNRFVINSRPITRTEHGVVVPHVAYGRYQLNAGQYWFATPNPKSFDSRYYGPVNDIQYQAWPIVTI